MRLVKTIGDEVMLESADTVALLDSALDLLDAADGEDDGFPQIAVGIARGEAISRGGDLFGHPVNLASRVTSAARPGSVLVTEEVKDAAGEERYAYSFAGERRLKGVKGAQKLFRARRADAQRDRASCPVTKRHSPPWPAWHANQPRVGGVRGASPGSSDQTADAV